MKTNTIVSLATKSFIVLSALCLLAVSIMAFNNPQTVMNLIQVKLTTTDAYSSIRGVYGGVGITIFISLLYLLKNDVRLALLFLCMLWGFYACSRICTIVIEGKLGNFGSQWLLIESILFIIALVLYLANRSLKSTNEQL